jgi:hypothetical protein
MKVLVLVFLTACSVFSPKASETLGESVRAYNEGIRWERFEVAAIHVPAKQRSQFVDESDVRAKDLKITDYDVIRVEQRGDREAHVQVKLEWYKSSEGTMHETHAVQTWERHGGDWLLVDESRLRGAEMPGLPEPITKD